MRAIAFVVSMLLADVVWAQDEPPRIPPGEDRIEALGTGDRAPFQGMLLDTDTSIRWTNARLWYHEKLRIVMESHGEEVAALNSHSATALRIVESSYGREITGLRQELRSQAERYARDLAMSRQETPWYKTFTFGMIMGATGAIVLVGLTAWAVSSVN